MKRFLPEIALTTVLVALAALLWNPYWMPMGAMLAVLMLFVVITGGFMAFVWREKGGDERDLFIRHVASRFAYLSGAFILAIGIVFQTLLKGSVDAWLIAAFIFMVVTKAAGYAYGKTKY